MGLGPGNPDDIDYNSPPICLQIASSCHVSPKVDRTSLCEVTMPGPGGVALASGPGVQGAGGSKQAGPMAACSPGLTA